MRSKLAMAGLALLLVAPACNGSRPVENDADAGGPDGPPDALADAPLPDAEQADAAPPPCTEEGATRIADCGNCGTRSEICQDGYWAPQSACIGEGECAAASVETGPAPLCGEQQRLCGMDCTWGEWSVTVPGTGDCEPGEERHDQADCAEGLGRDQTCSDTCEWVNAGECVDECGGVPRTSPDDSREVCIPAGAFIRGADPLRWNDECDPAREVWVSSYYIDVFPVTYGRYQACVDAGVCTVPEHPYSAGELADPAKADYYAQLISWDQARTFCEWDGRRLVTEAEWEKAARGPAPRDNWYPWDGTDYRCDLFYSAFCGAVATDSYSEPYYSEPGTRSYYGVEMSLGGGYQLVSDWYDSEYYSSDLSLVDPEGPATGTFHVARGTHRVLAQQYDRIVTRGVSEGGSIRCGRDAVTP